MKLSIALMALLVVAAVLAAPNMGNGAADKGMIDSAERAGCLRLREKCSSDSDCCTGRCEKKKKGNDWICKKCQDPPICNRGSDCCTGTCHRLHCKPPR